MENSCPPGERELEVAIEPVALGAREDRREALKRFGRYAAAAPTAMLLLEPQRGHAQELLRRRRRRREEGYQ